MHVVLEPVQALLADRFLVQAAWLTHSSLLRWILKLLPDPKYPKPLELWYHMVY